MHLCSSTHFTQFCLWFVDIEFYTCFAISLLFKNSDVKFRRKWFSLCGINSTKFYSWARNKIKLVCKRMLLTKCDFRLRNMTYTGPYYLGCKNSIQKFHIYTTASLKLYVTYFLDYHQEQKNRSDPGFFC